MNEVISFFVSPYQNTPTVYIVIEFIAMVFGIVSVIFAKKENILVYPTGIISTVLYVYLLSRWQMYGDLIINIYYTLMSIYGWWMWSKIVDEKSKQHIPITKSLKNDYLKAAGIFIFTSVFVIWVYRYYKVMPNELDFLGSVSYVWQHLSTGLLSQTRKITPFLDTFTTGMAFAAMWLMANKKLESWIFWIFVNIASVPLYFIKGYGFTGIQYFIFLILAFQGYNQWKRIMQQQSITHQ